MTIAHVPASLTAFAFGCLAASTLAEPLLEFRALVGTGQVGVDPALVPPADISRLAMFDPVHALIRTEVGENYLSDGVSLRRVMFAGAQIPGQPQGVVWGGTFRNEIWPLQAGGSYFSAIASGGDLGAPSNVLFAGDIDSPDILGWGIVSGCTRNGLRVRPQATGYEVGPIAGPYRVVIPTGFVPPGFTGTFNMSGHLPPRLNTRGELSFVGILRPPSGRSFPVACVADESGSRAVYNGSVPLPTDRGPVPFSNWFIFTSHALPDGSVVISENWDRSPGLWLIPPSGPAGVAATLALAGDRAAGTDEGVVIDNVRFLTANRSGTVLYLAELSGPGVDDDNHLGVFLWKAGQTTLISRSRAGRPSGGSSGARSLDFASMNDQGDIALLFDNSLSIYKPGGGTVTIAAINQPLPASSGIRGRVSWTSPPFEGSFSFSAEPFSGGDDDHYSLLSPDGWYFFKVATTFGEYVGSVRVLDLGCSSDFNLDGFTDFFDYVDFVTCFEGGRCPDGKPADFNDDGIADFFDYMEFVDAFETGC